MVVIKKTCQIYMNYHNFRPKLNFDNLKFYLYEFEERQIENDEIYELTKKLTDLAYPSYEDQYDKRWSYFYLPIKRRRKTIAIPIWIMEYNNDFFITIQSFGNFCIKKGDKKTDKFYRNVIKETLRFVAIVKKDEKILQTIIPYDIRTGKIKGRYVLDKLLPISEKKIMSKIYDEHIEKKLQIKDISLNDYLNIAAICYKAAYQKETENLSNLEMYKKWADGRDGEMLSIKDWDSKKEFFEWYNSGIYAGSHPFEIVFSWHDHGIHLYPPNDSSPYYTIRVTNYAYAWDFLKMVEAMIRMQIPFVSDDLDDVFNFLTGETYFTVNRRDEHHFMYEPSKINKKNYFPYIEWDEIQIVRWRNN